MSDKKEPRLTTQQKALTQYQDSLLMEIPDETTEELVVESPVVTEPVVETLSEPVDVVQTTEVVEPDLAVAESEVVASEIPDWGEEPFKTLFFNVGDTTLAAPLEKLSGILTECDDIKVIPGNTARYLGVIIHRGNTIRIVDFEHLVAELSGEPMSQVPAEVEPPKRIVLIEGERIGIACRDVAEVEEVAPSEVRWRVGTSKRPWYRGIVVGKMCALLDIDALLSILDDDGEQK